jgi:hypothetical protein
MTRPFRFLSRPTSSLRPEIAQSMPPESGGAWKSQACRIVGKSNVVEAAVICFKKD